MQSNEFRKSPYSRRDSSRSGEILVSQYSGNDTWTHTSDIRVFMDTGEYSGSIRNK